MKIYVSDHNMIGAHRTSIHPWNLVMGYGVYAYPTGEHPYDALKLGSAETHYTSIPRPQGGV